MSDGELVSVVIPVFNGGRYPAEAITSALAQTHAPIEVVVVDDGSTDDSADVARTFPEVRLLQQSNRGIGPARNAGVEASTGSFVSFLDADDLFRQTKTAMQLQALREASVTDLVLGHAREFMSPELTPQERPPVKFSNDPVPVHLPNSGLMSRVTFDRVGAFSDDAAGQGVDWYLRARDLGLELLMLDEVVFDRRIHRTNFRITSRHLNSSRLAGIKASLDRRRAQQEGTQPPGD